MNQSSLLGLFVDVSAFHCLVVGGGEVGLRKVKLLLGRGAKIKLVSPDVHPELEKMWQAGLIHVEKREFCKGDLDHADLVVSATNNRRTNQQIADLSRKMGLLCNIVDQPDLCNVIFPSMLQRGKLKIAISTSGASPALARKIREDLEELLGEEYELALEILWRLRNVLPVRVGRGPLRKDAFFAIVRSDFLELCRRKDFNGIDRLLESILGGGYSLNDLGIL